MIERYGKAYSEQVLRHSTLINRMAKFIPSRRKRKLHTGLFGYARNVSGTSLPRVITFTASLYSLGCPPELFGLDSLTDEDIQFLRQNYVNFDLDIRDALKFYNPKSPCTSLSLTKTIEHLFPDYEVDKAHLKLTTLIIDAMEQNQSIGLSDLVIQAANRRHFLG